MVCTSTAPIDLIAIVGTAPPLHFDVPLNRRLGVAPPPLATGSRHAVPPPVFAAPVPLVAPFQALIRLAKPDPRAQLLTQLFVHLRKRLVTTDRREVVAPSTDYRVQRLDQAFLCIHPMSAHHRPQMSLMTGHRLPARFDDGLVSPLRLRGVLPNVEPQAVKPGLPVLDVQGVGDAGFARLQFPSHVASVFRQHRLTALDHFALGMQGHQIIRIANHGRSVSAGKRSRDRLFQAVQGHVGC
jgi:hypothetical protein